MNRLIQEKNKHTETPIPVKVSRRQQKVKNVRFTSLMNNRDLHSLSQTQNMFLEAMLALTLEFC